MTHAERLGAFIVRAAYDDLLIGGGQTACGDGC